MWPQDKFNHEEQEHHQLYLWCFCVRVRVCHGEGSTGVFVVGRIHPSREVKTWVLVFQRGHFQALELCGARRHRAPVASLRACLVYCVAFVRLVCGHLGMCAFQLKVQYM